LFPPVLPRRRSRVPQPRAPTTTAPRKGLRGLPSGGGRAGLKAGVASTLRLARIVKVVAHINVACTIPPHPQHSAGVFVSQRGSRCPCKWPCGKGRTGLVGGLFVVLGYPAAHRVEHHLSGCCQPGGGQGITGSAAVQDTARPSCATACERAAQCGTPRARDGPNTLPLIYNTLSMSRSGGLFGWPQASSPEQAGCSKNLRSQSLKRLPRGVRTAARRLGQPHTCILFATQPSIPPAAQERHCSATARNHGKGDAYLALLRVGRHAEADGRARTDRRRHSSSRATKGRYACHRGEGERRGGDSSKDGRPDHGCVGLWRRRRSYSVYGFRPLKPPWLKGPK
jgi:hypothetical protein